MSDAQNLPAVGARLEPGASALVPCALCGADKGYLLLDGSTRRWWLLRCRACGADVGECRSNHGAQANALKPARWGAADDVWNAAGAHAERLREALRRLRAWGGLGNQSYSASVAFGVTDWIDAGMQGELPELPEYAKRLNGVAGPPVRE